MLLTLTGKNNYAADAMSVEIEVTHMLAEYYRVFSTLEMPSIAEYFHQPALLAGVQGVTSIPDSAALATSFAPVLANLKARGYGRSEFACLQLTPLSAVDALAIGTAIRLKTDGHELERAGITYLLHKTGAAWKIAAMVLHDPLAAVADLNRTS